MFLHPQSIALQADKKLPVTSSHLAHSVKIFLKAMEYFKGSNRKDAIKSGIMLLYEMLANSIKFNYRNSFFFSKVLL